MSFKLEIEMSWPVENWLNRQGFIVKKEFPTPWGICDLVGVDFNKRNIAKRIKYGQRKSIGSLCKAMLLSRIPDHNENKTITSKRLYGLFENYFSEDRISNELKKLVNDKFVYSPKTDHYYKLNGWMPIQKRIVAVELKLNRIQEALSQAYNHRLFTSESYVALPEETAIRVAIGNRKKDFILNGIGLLSVGKYNCQILIKAKTPTDNLNTNIQAYLVDRFWVGHIKGS